MINLQEISRKEPRIMQFALFGITIFILSLLFPNRPGFNYKYEDTTLWTYDDLYAPFDFPIKRSQSQLESAKDEIAQQFIPYFVEDKKAKERTIQFIESQFSQIYIDKDLSAEEVLHPEIEMFHKKLLGLIDRVYFKGIIQDTLPMTFKQVEIFYLVKANQELTLLRRDNFLSPDQIKDSISLMFEALSGKWIKDYESLFQDAIEPNMKFNEELSMKFRDEETGRISHFSGKIDKGELIIRRGGRLTPQIVQKLESLKDKMTEEGYTSKAYWIIYAGNLLLSVIIMGLYYLYLFFKEPQILFRFYKLSFLLMWFVLFSYLVFAIDRLEGVSPYLIPFCIVPIVIKNFLNERLAFITVIVLIMIASLITTLGLDYAVIMVLAGIVAVLFGTETRYWTRFFNSIFIILVTFFVGYFGLSLIRGEVFSAGSWNIYASLLVNGVLTLLAYPMIPLLERVFGFTSAITLAELSDLNKPLLKKLSIKAPGTFQHSIQVSNLAESAASKIEANSILAKVGALYHDIGKMKNPAYFIENAGSKSTHEKLNPLESAKIIVDHVNEGVIMAKEAGLPQVIIDFIKTHHGTTRVEFFFQKYKSQHPENAEDLKNFYYPGPRPRTKEQTIVMIADSIEAASRSVKFKNFEELEVFVDKIIQQKLQYGQLDHSELSFEELEICRKVFKKMVRSIYHGRITYPESTEK